ncbi:unnamed protein product [Cunninghamella blakesleeana]
MGKSKRNINPADALRKQQRKRELKKNKEIRKNAREAGLAKKDTTKILADIARLEGLERNGAIDRNGNAKLKLLRDELAQIEKAKKEVHKPLSKAQEALLARQQQQQSGDSRKLVFDPKSGKFVPVKKKDSTSKKGKGDQKSDMSDDDDDDSDSSEDSSLSNDEESDENIEGIELEINEEDDQQKEQKEIINNNNNNDDGEQMNIDLLDNEKGTIIQSASEVMVTTEENDLSDRKEIDQDDKMENEKDNQIDDDQENDNNDIPLPEGSPTNLVKDNEDNDDYDSDDDIDIPLPPGPPPPQPFKNQLVRPHPSMMRPPPPPPPIHGRPPHFIQRPPPYGYPNQHYMRPPPPPPGRPPFSHRPPPHMYQHRPPPHYMNRPMRPVRPHHRQHHPYHRPPTTHSAPTVTAPPITSEPSKTATISAEPQIRDLQKELVTFVPAALRRKQAQAKKAESLPKNAKPSNINLAPDVEE